MDKIEEYILNIPEDLFSEIDRKKEILDSKRPLPRETINSLRENSVLEWTYNSNAIEGNTLTLIETKVVLEGITVGGKSMREHLEAINHKEAIGYLEELVKKENLLSELDIKGIHKLVLKGIDDKVAGTYRKGQVVISGATFVPPAGILVRDKMEQLILQYTKWNKKYHPLVVAALMHGEFVKIHPFEDGNGRVARLIMNFVAMRSGYTPIVIKKEVRKEYYLALDKAATTLDYTDFIKLVAKASNESLDLYLKVI
ncbi:MAG: Fic family protein [Clostridia bacterium]